MANNTGKKFGGRKKGTPNKTTREIREVIQNLTGEYYSDKLESDLKELHPKQRLEVMISLSKFILPQLKSTDLKVGAEEDFKPYVIDMSKWK